MAQLFEPLAIRQVTLKNRIVMSPMCQYSAGTDGVATDWHLVHYGARAVGGTGLIILEATAVESRGRISEHDLGLWDDGQVPGLKRIVDFCHSQGAKVAVQLAHAGRKTWSFTKGKTPDSGVPAEPIVAPSAIPFGPDWVTPAALTEADIEQVVEAWRQAAVRAKAAGFDFVEIHGAHGYLVHEFLSPLSNQREDNYGGSFENRTRLLRRITEAVRSVWPAEAPVFLRVSASDYTQGGLQVEDLVQVAREAKAWGVDLVDVSSGGNVPVAPPAWPGYQVPFSERIRREAGVLTGAVGLITEPEMAEEILSNGRADVIILARELLRHPQWALSAAKALGQNIEWPVPYGRAKR
ncbi:MAG: NADPH dehydrogenase NamA [Symbiobacteriia bacterium]